MKTILNKNYYTIKDVAEALQMNYMAARLLLLKSEEIPKVTIGKAKYLTEEVFNNLESYIIKK